MFKTSFYITFSIIIGGVALVQIVYYFKFRRDKGRSESDHALWQLKFTMVWIAAVIYLAAFYLPSGFYVPISAKDSAPDVLQTLVRNQERIGNDIQQIHELGSYLALMTALSLTGVATSIGRLQRERRKQTFLADPKVSKPLGLT